MAEKGNNISRLVNESVNASIEFEALMDSTDFDSWLESDNPNVLKGFKQEINPFNKFKKNKKKLESICCRMRKKGTSELPKSEDKSSLERHLIYQLFRAKSKRLDARISSCKKDEEDRYEEGLYILLTALNDLQKSGVDKEYRRHWLTFIYNDLSICYAGLGNSSISRGYAEEAIKIIKKEKSYKEFDKRLNAGNSTNRADIENCHFVSSKLYDLYTVALFNQAVAEKRSSLYTEAERNFKKIIEKDTCLINFNYDSAIVNLSDLYIEQGRGMEALKLLNIVTNKKREDDIRYWNASLYEITALIDQSRYGDAEKLLLDKFIKKENGLALSERHKVTSPGFKALNYFARCKIEKVKNTLRNSGENELKEAEKILKDILKDKDNINTLNVRSQKGLEMKTYKHLSEIYTLLKKDTTAMKYFIKYLSNGEIDELKSFVSDPKMGDWIDKCDNLDFLESFIEEICKFLKRNGRRLDKTSSQKILEKIRERIKRECDARGQLSRAEKIVRKINEVLGETEDITYKEGIFFNESSGSEEKSLIEEDVIKRLDINEKEFDSVLFKRSKIKKDNHIVEVVVLRRWNSFSPGLYRESTGSLGGGYLLRINKDLLKKRDKEVSKRGKKENSEREKIENIVIDPGYNFLQNFRSEGFHIEDIDTIVVTHSHLDHCAELLPIMDLIYQINKRYEHTPNTKRQKKRVNLCLSQGTYKKFSSYTDDPDWQKQLEDVIILENLPEKKWELVPGLIISAIPTHHMDLGGVNAIGLKIEIDRIRGNKKGGLKKLCLGFTSDTPWYPKIREDFKECDFLCVHLGGIKYQEIGYTDDRCNLTGRVRKIPKNKRREEFSKAYTKANHLLFFGTKALIESCAETKDNNLIIIGEFGEELKYGLRIDLCKKLSKKRFIDCLPGDIGLYIGIEKDGTKKVRCNFCEEFVEQKEIGTFVYGREDAIHYICQTCNNTLSELQKQTLIEYKETRH